MEWRDSRASLAVCLEPPGGEFCKHSGPFCPAGAPTVHRRSGFLSGQFFPETESSEAGGIYRLPEDAEIVALVTARLA